jgi:hypothetical protein
MLLGLEGDLVAVYSDSTLGSARMSSTSSSWNPWWLGSPLSLAGLVDPSGQHSEGGEGKVVSL